MDVVLFIIFVGGMVISEWLGLGSLLWRSLSPWEVGAAEAVWIWLDILFIRVPAQKAATRLHRWQESEPLDVGKLDRVRVHFYVCICLVLSAEVVWEGSFASLGLFVRILWECLLKHGKWILRRGFITNIQHSFEMGKEVGNEWCDIKIVRELNGI